MSTAKDGHIQCSEATFDALETALPYLQVGPIVLPPPEHLACWPRASPQTFDLLVARAAHLCRAFQHVGSDLTTTFMGVVYAKGKGCMKTFCLASRPVGRAAPPLLLRHHLLDRLAGRLAMPSLAALDSGRTTASSAQYVTGETARDMISARPLTEWPSARHPAPFALASTLPAVSAGGISAGPAVADPPYPASDVLPTPPACPDASSKASPLLQPMDAHPRHERRSSVLGLSVVDVSPSPCDVRRLPSAESVVEDVGRFSRGPEVVTSAATFVDSRAGSPSLHQTAHETEHRLLELVDLITMPPLTALLKEGEPEHVSITLHEGVAVLFADIQGFTALCEGSDSTVLIQQLHELYTSFDSATKEAGLWKVDTVRHCDVSVNTNTGPLCTSPLDCRLVMRTSQSVESATLAPLLRANESVA